MSLSRLFQVLSRSPNLEKLGLAEFLFHKEITGEEADPLYLPKLQELALHWISVPFANQLVRLIQAPDCRYISIQSQVVSELDPKLFVSLTSNFLQSFKARLAQCWISGGRLEISLGITSDVEISLRDRGSDEKGSGARGAVGSSVELHNVASTAVILNYIACACDAAGAVSPCHPTFSISLDVAAPALIDLLDAQTLLDLERLHHIDNVYLKRCQEGTSPFLSALSSPRTTTPAEHTWLLPRLRTITFDDSIVDEEELLLLVERRRGMTSDVGHSSISPIRMITIRHSPMEISANLRAGLGGILVVQERWLPPGHGLYLRRAAMTEADSETAVPVIEEVEAGEVGNHGQGRTSETPERRFKWLCC